MPSDLKRIFIQNIASIKLVAAMLFWAGGFVAGKTLVAEIPVAQSAFSRFFLVSIVYFIVCYHNKISLSLKRAEFLPLLSLGLRGIAIYNLCFFKAIQTTEVAKASIIIGSNPILVMIGSFFIFKEHISCRKFLGILCSVFGAYYVLTRGSLDGLKGFSSGDFFLLGAMFSWAAYSLIAKRYNKEIHPLKLQYYSALFGAMCLIPSAFTEYQHTPALANLLTSWSSLTSLVYLAIFPTALGFYWYVSAISQMGAARASQFINLVPIFTVVLGGLMLAEFPDHSLYFGGFLVLSGLFLGRSSQKTSISQSLNVQMKHS